MPDYGTRVMDSVSPPEQSVSSCRRYSRMWAVQDGTGSGVARGLPVEVTALVRRGLPIEVTVPAR